MAGISTKVSVQDGFSGAFRTMTQSINICLSSFENLQAATGQGVNTATIQAARASLNDVNIAASQVSTELQEAGERQQQFNNQVTRGHSAMSGLVGKALGLVGAYASMQAVKGVFGLSDEMAQTTARLNLMNDGLQTTAALQGLIFQSAQDSRAAYADTASSVAKLGMLAGKAFSNTKEIVKFTELMNKNFVVGGASATEQASAMYQLTQAMASGKLQGDEYKSIIENAPLLANSIEDYMTNVEHAEGSMKDWASEGLLTANVIRAAVFNTADQIDERLSTIPMTWGQVATSMQNQALIVFQPILNKINELANNEKFQNMSDGIINGLVAVSSAATQAFDVLGNGASVVYDNWSTIEPLIWGVAAAVGFYAVATGISAIATWASVAANQALIFTLLANPLTWIALMIGWVVMNIYKWVQSVGGVKIAWEICMDALKYSWEMFQWGFMTGVYAVLNLWDNLKVKWASATASVVTFTSNLKVEVLQILDNMINGAINIINSFIGSLNKIPGVSIDAITFTSNFAANAASEAADLQAKYSEAATAAQLLAENNANARSLELAGMKSAAEAAHGTRQAEINKMQLEAAAGATTDSTSNAYDSIASSTGATADNTSDIADSLEITDEDLKYLRDIAEREIIDRTVFKSLRVDMGGVSNTVNNMTDLDGIADYLGDVISETASASMEG